MKIATFGMRRPFHPGLLIPVIRTRIFTCFLAVLFAICTLHVSAQTGTKVKTPADLSIGDDPKKGTSTSTGTTLFCSASSGFTLKSSTKDPSNPTVSYTSWAWQELDETGVAAALPGTAVPTNEKLVVSSASPGWHTYQVVASTGTAGCPADPVIFTVFVLPDLTITSVVDPANSPDLTYCAANGAPTGTKAINLKSDVKFATTLRTIPGLKAYTIDDFDLTYTWSKEEVGGAKVTVGTNAAGYTITDPAVTAAGTEKQFKYSVQVAYTVKSCGTYTATSQFSGTDAIITVTPKPGTPVITIE